MNLFIVESPAKAKTIAKYLAIIAPKDEFEVRASIGHIRDLPKNNTKAIDIPGGFIPRYEISKGKEKVIHELTQLAKKAKMIYIATDPDREGEAIAWHITQVLKDGIGADIPFKRITYVEITKEAIKEALEHPRDIDEHLKEAQEARRVLDRLVGYDLSGLIWKKVRYGLSAGRVQSPALRIVVEREREIRAFVPETFYLLDALFENKAKKQIHAAVEETYKDKKIAEELEAKIKTATWKVTDLTTTATKRSPRAPFTTSTLQQAASSELGFSPSRTMALAQKLYEAGAITYMRTDSSTISKVALDQIYITIEEKFGRQYLEPRIYASKSKNAQEAHEAIRPSNIKDTQAGKSEDENRLYALIWRRTIASQMADAAIDRSKVIIGSNGLPDFTATGHTVTFEGFLKVDNEAQENYEALPTLSVGETLNLNTLSVLEKQTEGPRRFTEAGLIKELEKRGIGRPSTYASIIKTLEDRGYVEKINRSLKATDTGEVVSDFLFAHFAEYTNDAFTASMEEQLDDIATGARGYKQTLKDFYTPFRKAVNDKQDAPKITTLGDADTQHVCPTCGGAMDIKLGRNGKFLSCKKYPECEGALTIEGKVLASDQKLLGEDPETKLPIYLKSGMYGWYVQLGDRVKGKRKKPKMSSIEVGKDPQTVTLTDALKYLTLPRELGVHPETNLPISANVGRFGPYVVHNKDFRSIKEENVYTIELKRALEILSQPKVRRGRFKKKEEKS